MVALLLSTALHAAAVPEPQPGAISARLAEVAPLRSQRIARTAPAIPESAWKKAAGGQIATGVQRNGDAAVGTGWGVALFDVPIGALWSGLNDEMNHKELVGLSHVEIIKGSRCADHRQIMMMLPLPIVSDRWWVVQDRYNTSLAASTSGRVMELTWSLVPDPLAALSPALQQKVADAVLTTANTGAWLLIDLDGSRTLAEYHAISNPGGDVPAGPATSFASATIADTMRKMADYAASGKSACPRP
jgi:hypothetical protein